MTVVQILVQITAVKKLNASLLPTVDFFAKHSVSCCTITTVLTSPPTTNVHAFCASRSMPLIIFSLCKLHDANDLILPLGKVERSNYLHVSQRYLCILNQYTLNIVQNSKFKSYEPILEYRIRSNYRVLGFRTRGVGHCLNAFALVFICIYMFVSNLDY